MHLEEQLGVQPDNRDVVYTDRLQVEITGRGVTTGGRLHE